ncbi:30S ribosomal protein S4 [Candidatus Wolfebacteria bacterium]|nr:30S ribosomal protein S4 [Candidatus Wolfebacteria bacterium]
MARIKAKEKKERSLGVKLFLKAHRCNSPKCAMVRHATKPGMHGKRRRQSASEFGQQLAEKQKIKVIYGLKEAQIRKIFQEAVRKGTASQVLGTLERRFDNVIFRLGFAPSRIVARQYISHGHFMINGIKTNIPSYRARIGDVISVKPSSKDLLIFKELPNTIKKHDLPDWLTINFDKMEGKVKSLPINVEEELFNINLVVDYYSR